MFIRTRQSSTLFDRSRAYIGTQSRMRLSTQAKGQVAWKLVQICQIICAHADFRHILLPWDWLFARVIEKLPSQYRGEDVSSEDKEKYVHFPLLCRTSLIKYKCFRYKALYERLVSLDNKRQEQQRRLAQYKQLESLLEPFKNPQENIQPNLITRDGELVREIDKMRMLVARVGGRIQNTRVIQTGDSSATISATDPEDRLAALPEAIPWRSLDACFFTLLSSKLSRNHERRVNTMGFVHSEPCRTRILKIYAVNRVLVMISHLSIWPSPGSNW